MKQTIALAALLLAAFSQSCGDDGPDDPAPVANSMNTLTHDGIARTFLLHVPPGYSERRPVSLVIGLHGYTSSSTSFEGQSALSPKADAEGFIVAYPDGLRYPWTSSNPQAWNAGAIYETWTGGTDDVGFIAQMIGLIERHYSIDPARIFVTGHSNGSRMTYRVGYELACTIAAIAPHSGQMVYQSPSRPACPVPVLHLHAIDDDTVLYGGAAPSDPSALAYPSVETVLGNWAAFFGCGAGPDVTATNDDYATLKWRCPGDYPTIELIRTNRGEHHWFRTDNSGVAGTDVIWEFFKAHPKR